MMTQLQDVEKNMQGRLRILYRSDLPWPGAPSATAVKDLPLNRKGVATGESIAAATASSQESE